MVTPAHESYERPDPLGLPLPEPPQGLATPPEPGGAAVDLATQCSPRLLGIFVVLVVILAAMILTAESYTEKDDRAPATQAPPYPSQR
jgi:hypothetical protein